MAHPGGHGHGGDGVGGREHGLRGEGTHGVEEGEVLGGQRCRSEALVGPVVVGISRVHVVIRLHETAELGQVAVLAQVHLLVPLPLPPLSPAVFEPHLEGTHRTVSINQNAVKCKINFLDDTGMTRVHIRSSISSSCDIQFMKHKCNFFFLKTTLMIIY